MWKPGTSTARLDAGARGFPSQHFETSYSLAHLACACRPGRNSKNIFQADNFGSLVRRGSGGWPTEHRERGRPPSNKGLFRILMVAESDRHGRQKNR